MVERHAQVHHRADGDGIVNHHRALLDSFCGQDGGLGMVDNGLGHGGTKRTGIIQGEGSALDIFQGQLILPSPPGPIGQGMGQTGNTETIGVMNHRHDEPGRGGYGYSDIDAALEDYLVFSPAGVKSGIFPQGLRHHLDDEGQVGKIDSVLLFKLRPNLRTPRHQPRNIHFYRAPSVGYLADTADHRLCN